MPKFFDAGPVAAMTYVTVAAALAIASAGCSEPAKVRPTSSSVPLAMVLPAKTMPEVVQSARQDVYWLADDAREGRGLGTHGLADAGQFIADRFEHVGLLPVPSLGGYFQTFNYESGPQLGSGTRLALNGTPLDKRQFTGFTNAKPGEALGEIAFVGYAIRSPDHDYDDFADVDVHGKVALAMRWEPHDDDGKSRWADAGNWSNEAAIARKAEQAAKAGATALIIVNAPFHHDDAERLMDPRGGLRRRAAIPVFHVTIDAANKMLAAGGAPDLATLQKEIDASGKPRSRVVANATIDAAIEMNVPSSTERNVVAMLPGVGPHANEYVVVGAHYDHVGRGAVGAPLGTVGKIHNGADDNASGTAALLQLAEEFALAGRQDRSILFVAFTLEERGLIGSGRFVDALPVPRESIAGMLNLDMVGRMRDEHLYVAGGGTAAAFHSILSAADARSPIGLYSIGEGGRGPTDHQNFARIGVPVLFFFTGMHSDYHLPSDDAYKVNYDGIGQIVYLAFDVVRQMCAMDRQTYVGRFDNTKLDVAVQPGEEPKPQTSYLRTLLGIVSTTKPATAP